VMWALAKLCRIFAICWSALNTLKTLKNSSRNRCESMTDIKADADACVDSLIFWTILGFVVVWEKYFEFVVSWIPGQFSNCAASLILDQVETTDFRRIFLFKSDCTGTYIIPEIKNRKRCVWLYCDSCAGSIKQTNWQ
jgi:hypothetical protein